MSKLYDLIKIKELSEDDPDFIKAMVDTFIEEIPMDLEQLATAIVGDDRAMVFEYSHKIKPTVDMFGLSCLYDVLVLEAWGKSDDQMDIKEHFMRVQENLQNAVEQLKADF
ncbi:Hpt domain-containing protein [Nonlabens antarcticus]|uniref:Hpt domain-containing protein n=1 Tax=Nonlabens antarcticus TaxID=392714 RepID=UPI001890C14D|nr:Hpt domain-containing protein [Nonlabens antarcticus]